MPTISLGLALADPNSFARHFRNKSCGVEDVFAGSVCRASRSGRPRDLSRQNRADDMAYGAVH